ncbi:MAG: type II toxin-antitoxin system VapC family toxin [Legionellales bacterium]|jgi:hypothetical protein
MKVYFDTSAFIKRYLLEQGSEQVPLILNKASALALSALSLPEMISALTRLKHEKKLTTHLYQTIKNKIYDDLTNIILYPMTPQVITLTTEIIENNKVKTLDAIHIASASVWMCDYFVSADKIQISVAKKIGLKIIDVSETTNN